MGMKQTTTEAEISGYVEERLEIWRGLIVRNLCAVGERCLNAARGSRGYEDQTGNLRSSTGYVVVDNGQIVELSSFEPVKSGVEGQASGRKFAERLAKRRRRGVVLIVVAGMEYAAYVASKRDVLDSAELLARRLVPEMLSKLRRRK